MQRLTVIKAVMNQDDPRGEPVVLTYGEDPTGFVTIAVPHDGERGPGDRLVATASVTVADLLRFARLVATDSRVKA